MTTDEIIKEIVELVGRFIIENASELYPVEYSDLTGDEFFIRMIRRKYVPD